MIVSRGSWLPPACAVSMFAAMVGCGAKSVVCPVIHAADELCPYVIAVMPDGTRVQIPRAEFLRTVETYRGDGGK